MQTFDPTVDHTRSFTTRATADADTREIRGIGVPLGVETVIWPGLRESFDQDCQFDGIERSKFRTHHRDLIGVISSHERVAGAMNIVGRASQVTAGDEALTLARDGALDSFSIGFRPLEYSETRNDDGSTSIRHTRVLVREFSLTDNPAYTGAIVTATREAHPTEGAPPMTGTLTREDVERQFDTLSEDLTRTLDTRLADFQSTQTAPTIDTRSAGLVLQQLAGGDEIAIREYNDLMERAYTGGTSADSPIKDGWVGDLTRLFDSSSGVLSAVFSTGTLPDKGMNIEYAELLTNTVKVEEQAAEGDDLAYGKVTLTTKTTPVKTYGGYTELTIQEIKRSTLPILDRHLEAMTLAAGARKKAVLRAAYLALVAARVAIAANAGVLTLGATLAASTANQWTNLIVDAAVRFDALNLPLEGLLVSPDVFKRFNALEVAGHRVFNVSSERNTIGTLDLPALRGDLGGITVVADPGRTGEAAEFVNGRALRQYDTQVTQLQDENIINLSKSFSVYKFGAVAAEIPQAVVPVKLTA